MNKSYITLAFAALIIFVASFTAQAAPNTNSHQEATGTFNFVVEPPLTITTITGTQDLGAICPGCSIQFESPKCLEWKVSGGASCNVQVTMSETTPAPTGVTITTAKSYKDDSGFEAYPGEHTANVWRIGTHDLRYRVCASSISASSDAVATTSGTSVWTIVADYTNAAAPHL